MYIPKAVFVCVHACVRACVRGWVGGWVGGRVCVCARPCCFSPDKVSKQDAAETNLVALRPERTRCLARSEM